MLVTFLTASATSALVIAAYNAQTAKRQLSVKADSTLGWLGTYDGNIIGGAAIGLGMSLTGACPGTVLVQAAAGVGNSRLLLLSSIFAGAAFAKWKRSGAIRFASKKPNGTIMSTFSWSTSRTVLAYEAVMIGITAAALTFAKRSNALVHPVLGGLLIGAGQLTSVLLVKKPVGVSTAYEDIGNIIHDASHSKKIEAIPDSVVFTIGMLFGSVLTMVKVPMTVGALNESPSPSPLLSMIGGFVLVFGARIAGGCTSGHGISGMAGMGISSFITVALMFGAGISTTALTDYLSRLLT